MSTAIAESEADAKAAEVAYLKDVFGLVPRPYQVDAFSAVTSGFVAEILSQLLVMATGTGKTVVFGMVAKWVIEELFGRVLILAHRGELLAQAINTLTGMGIEPVLEKAGEHACPHFTDADAAKKKAKGAHLETLFGVEVEIASDPKCVVASVQTMQGARLLAWPEGHFDLVICDEAHHASAASYRKVIAHLKPKYYLGVTATWDRGDKTPIVGEGQPFAKLAYEYNIGRAVREGWLARPAYKCLPCDVDLSEIRTTAGDLNAGDLEAAIKPHIQTLVNECIPYLVGKRFMCFTPDVGSAEAIASAFRSESLPEGSRLDCRSVSGDDPDRDRTVAEFKANLFPGIANCALLTEGFDCPDVDAIVMFRPTKSRALFMQMIGRGTRLHPGKANCRVIGFNWKTFKHKIIRPVEIFDEPGKEVYEPEVMDAAQDLLDAGECTDVMQALKRAEPIVKRKKFECRIAEQARAAKACDYDPIDGEEADAPPQRDTGGEAFSAMVTPRQMETLEKMGYKPADVVNLTKRVASAILDKQFARRKAGLASYKQTRLLKRLKYQGDVMALTFEGATAEINKLKVW